MVMSPGLKPGGASPALTVTGDARDLMIVTALPAVDESRMPTWVIVPHPADGTGKTMLVVLIICPLLGAPNALVTSTRWYPPPDTSVPVPASASITPVYSAIQSDVGRVTDWLGRKTQLATLFSYSFDRSDISCYRGCWDDRAECADGRGVPRVPIAAFGPMDAKGWNLKA